MEELVGEEDGPGVILWILQAIWSLSFCLISLLICLLLIIWLWKELTMGVYRNANAINLHGKVVVVTGGNNGVGFETAKVIARQGAKVIIASRSEEKGEKAVREIIRETGNAKVVFKPLNLLSLASVRDFAESLKRDEAKIDILINNAGMSDDRGASSWLKGESYLSGDGLEKVTQTNHFGHFLLTNLVKDLLAEANGARVVNLSSMVNKFGNIQPNNINYETNHEKEALSKTYANSKLMAILFSFELNKRWKDIGVTSYAAHPGFVRSGFFDNFSAKRKGLIMVLGQLLGKNNWQGAQTSLFAALEPGIEESLSGVLLADCRRADYMANKQAQDPNIAQALWKRSAELVGL